MRNWLLIALWLAVATAPAAAAETTVTVLSSDSRGAVVELTVGDYQFDTLFAGGVTFRHISAEGLATDAKPGDPLLPVKGTLLGVPAQTRLSIRVLDAEYQSMKTVRVAPAPTLIRVPEPGETPERALVESAAYRASGFMPHELVTQGFSGAMRDQPVIQLLFHPVQFNAERNEVRLYHRIRVAVSYEADFSRPAPRPAGPRAKSGANAPAPERQFEDVLRQNIINYGDR